MNLESNTHRKGLIESDKNELDMLAFVGAKTFLEPCLGLKPTRLKKLYQSLTYLYKRTIFN